MPSIDIFDLLIKIAAGLAAPLGGLAIWAITRHVRLTHLQTEHETLRRDKENLEGKLEETRRTADEARQASADRYDKLRDKYNDAREKFYRIKEAALDQREELERLRVSPPAVESNPTELQELARRNEELECQLAGAQRELREEQERVAEAARTDGRIWLRPAPDNAPAFRPASERNSTIISVLNFKGGVGKTTITANLAATFGQLDKPTLLLDLDYQRSLSMLLVESKERKLLHHAGHSVQHFLQSNEHSAAELLKRVRDLSPQSPKCGLLPNSDSRAGHGEDGLEETESRLMINWLLHGPSRDPRYFLRQALHERALGDAYRFVLLDCPPRLTTACVNALAASDYVLIPVVPDAISTRAAENLLETLRTFRNTLFPQLRVLAIVPNMVRLRNDEPIRAHADALIDLKAAIVDRWDESIRITDASIKHDPAFGASAALLDHSKPLKLATEDAAVGASFQQLARELLKEIKDHESRRSSTVPRQSGERVGSSR